jgi:hypothetical protein
MYKYVYKGPNRVTTVVERQADTPGQENNAQVVVANGEWQNRDEIKAYLEGRYVSASEASWHLFSFRMHNGTPSVTRLAVREPGMHMVMYNDNASIFEIVNNEQNQKITFTEYFQANIDTPWPKKSHTWIFPLCLHGPIGQKNGPSSKEGAMSGAFILLVLCCP